MQSLRLVALVVILTAASAAAFAQERGMRETNPGPTRRRGQRVAQERHHLLDGGGHPARRLGHQACRWPHQRLFHPVR